MSVPENRESLLVVGQRAGLAIQKPDIFSRSIQATAGACSRPSLTFKVPRDYAYVDLERKAPSCDRSWWICTLGRVQQWLYLGHEQLTYVKLARY